MKQLKVINSPYPNNWQLDAAGERPRYRAVGKTYGRTKAV